MMLYAVNIETKEHISTDLSEWNAGNWPNNKYKIIDADSDGWIQWSGCNKCPVPPNQKVEVIFFYR